MDNENKNRKRLYNSRLKRLFCFQKYSVIMVKSIHWAYMVFRSSKSYLCAAKMIDL